MVGLALNIVLVNAADVGGGAERLVATLHDGLRHAGHQSSLRVGYKYRDDADTTVIQQRRPFPGALGLARRLESFTGLQNLYAPGFRSLAAELPASTHGFATERYFPLSIPWRSLASFPASSDVDRGSQATPMAPYGASQ